MEIIVETTEQDYIDFYKAYGFQRNWLRRSLILLLVDLILTATVQKSNEVVWAHYFVQLIIIGILLFPFFFIIPYLISRAKLKRAFEQMPSPFSKKTYRPFAVGVEVIDETGDQFLKYRHIKQAGIVGNYLFLTLSNGDYYLLPKWCFSSGDEAAHFLGIVNSGIAIEYVQPHGKFKSYYFWGILCLIPFIGFIAGVVIVFRALFVLRDMLFAVIGVTGIVITIFFIHYLATSPENRKEFAIIAQTEINDLVKNIEFYKMQNGVYPDSLKQVIDKDGFTSIFDISQEARSDGHLPLYKYKKIGNRYLLFSPGPDGKPNTKDDIYPTLTNPDTSKLGFIRK